MEVSDREKVMASHVVRGPGVRTGLENAVEQEATKSRKERKTELLRFITPKSRHKDASKENMVLQAVQGKMKVQQAFPNQQPVLS
ncbi:hypothetical protein ILUMI_16969 [Ignelater luminosus]|uniref:Uncharacterized protein n=1 Tax=Ignelater luminosus TaxID=2038154 RepID=A0A8K0CMK5_IGNLU|nr:hypothetical protein ILUMI_16969 [Ignelater luminosus]